MEAMKGSIAHRVQGEFNLSEKSDHPVNSWGYLKKLRDHR